MSYSDRRDGPSRTARRNGTKALDRVRCQKATQSVVRRARKGRINFVGTGPHSPVASTNRPAGTPAPFAPVYRVYRVANTAGRVMEIEAENEAQACIIAMLNKLVKKAENARVIELVVPSL